jgi:two-component system, NtrC family, sensor kinase
MGMQTPPSIENEECRLAALHEYDILDSLPESSYDDIAILASMICGTPVAMISLVDKNRQWFKARVGVDAAETSRDISFCGHAIAQSNLFVVKDAHLDGRFMGNPLVDGELGVRFYAGAPLVTPAGDAIGTLCVIDREPRDLNEQQKSALQALARQVVQLLELRKKNKELLGSLTQLEEHARTISTQQDLLVYSAKMTAIGNMAGGVAHEINNPLAVICARADMMIEALKSGKSTCEDLEKGLLNIQKTGFRIARIIKGLLAISRESGPPQIVSTETTHLFEDAIALSEQKLKSVGAEVNIDPGAQGLRIQCCPVQITQVLTNLFSNACDAMESSEERRIDILVLAGSEYVDIRVCDTGAGIPEAIRPKIMDPFFTTKPPGKGTGLGLSISKGLVESQDGQLFQDTMAQKTTFVIRLPMAVARVSRPPKVA